MLLHAGGAVAFAICSQMVDYRFFTVSVSGIYEKTRGWSYFTELAALFFLCLALLIALAQLVQLAAGASKHAAHSMIQQYSEEPYSTGGASSASRQVGSYLGSEITCPSGLPLHVGLADGPVRVTIRNERLAGAAALPLVS